MLLSTSKTWKLIEDSHSRKIRYLKSDTIGFHGVKFFILIVCHCSSRCSPIIVGPAASAPNDMCTSDPTYCFLSLYVLVAGAVNVVFLLVAASFELFPKKSPICQKALLVPTCLCMVGWWAYGELRLPFKPRELSNGTSVMNYHLRPHCRELK